MPKYSLRRKMFRDRNVECELADGGSTCNTHLLEFPRRDNVKFSSLPTPPATPPPSIPSVVFPRKTAPSPSTESFSRRALAIRLRCRSESFEDEGVTPESKKTYKCPTLNLLRNIKRTGLPSPRPPSPEPPSLGLHCPNGSSRASSPVQISRSSSSAEVGRSAVSNTTPPVLTLPGEEMDMGLGWTDEFGIMIDTGVAPLHPWSTALSRSSQETSWSQPSRPASPYSMREYPTSSTDFFTLASTPLTMPSPTTVLTAAEQGHGQVSPPAGASDPFHSCEDDISPDDEQPSVAVRFLEHYELPPPPPRLGFRLRRSSEDWASAVLKAIGSSPDTV